MDKSVKSSQSDKSVVDMAFTLAASIPSYLGQPTTPPIAWAQVGEIVIVILADGRKVSASIQDINKLMFVGVGDPPAHKPVQAPAPVIKPPEIHIPASSGKPTTTPARRAVKK